MGASEQALAERLRDLRRRHFGPRGAAEFARRLGLSADDYARLERGVVPPGETLVRICEVTGEDLQWLLTGVAARGTVVISGTRTRHQELLTRLARLLDENPGVAAPIEAFVDLLIAGDRAQIATNRALPPPPFGELIPVFEPADAPAALPLPGTGGPEGGQWLARHTTALSNARRRPARLIEPVMSAPADEERGQVVALLDELEAAPSAAGTPAGRWAGRPRAFVHAPHLAECLPGLLGIWIVDAAMRPLFVEGDVALVAPGSPPRAGVPAICRLADAAGARCRVWLGEDGDHVHLGRLADGGQEDLPRAAVSWSLEALYRLSLAA
jgi:transcriptional regulator with XRE-family HTH domain